MNKALAIVATSVIALHGCGGDSGSSTGIDTDKSSGSNSFDFPIKGSNFSPEKLSFISYKTYQDGEENEEIRFAYSSISTTDLLTRLQDELDQAQINGSEEATDITKLKRWVEDKQNQGSEHFFGLDTFVFGEDPEFSVLYQGGDDFTHLVDSSIEVSKEHNKDLFVTNPLFKHSGSAVKQKDPNLDISHNSIQRELNTSAGQLADLLDVFYPNGVDDLGPEDTQCRLVWSQQIKENGQRVSVSIQGKNIETAYLGVENYYNVSCGDYGTTDFKLNTEIWFNPSFGLVKQIELTEKNNIQLHEEVMSLHSFTFNNG